MSEFLKGNFEVKNKVEETEKDKSKDSKTRLQDELRKAALASIGGSMVYVERTDLSWDGDEEETDAEEKSE